MDQDVLCALAFSAYPHQAAPAGTRRAAIACATVAEGMRPHLPPGTARHVPDLWLHIHPQKPKQALQETIETLAEERP